MRLLKWTSSHAVFVEEIDDDHKEIFAVVGEIQTVLSGDRPPDTLKELTRRLAVRIEDHFAHEERLMRAARYGLLSWHKRCHDAARQRVSRFIRRMDRGDAGAGPALVGYLTAWLWNHTRLPDRMLGAFLRNERLAAQIVFTAGTKAPDACTWVDSRGDRFDPKGVER